MQRNDIILSTVVSHLEESMVRIECGHPVPGGHLATFLQMVENGPSFQGVALRGSLEGKSKQGGVMTASLQSEIETAVGLCTKGLSERFDILLQADCQPSSKAPATGHGPKEVVRDMLMFNVDAWPTCSADLVDYGREEIQRLSKWFEVALQRAGCTPKKIEDQWVSPKIQINSQFRKLDYTNLWATMLTKVPYKENFKDVLHLVEILLVLPISAAQCEQAVSSQNRIKSSTRATLSVSVLEDLIRLSSEGPPIADFDPAPAVDRWFARNKSKGERSRRPHFLNN